MSSFRRESLAPPGELLAIGAALTDVIVPYTARRGLKPSASRRRPFLNTVWSPEIDTVHLSILGTPMLLYVKPS